MFARPLRVFAAALLLALVVALIGLPASAAPDLPALTGRVVDNAHILSATKRADLEGKLADLEAKSGIQLVVATVPSIGGQAIEPYANALFRAWRLGEAKNNNGVLFLVAPNQHRMRIEVGYGLEGTLTDATSKLIIANAVAPRFKAGDFDGGVGRAVDDIITVLTTDSANWRKSPDLRGHQGSSKGILPPFFVFLIVLAPIVVIVTVFAVLFIVAWRRGGLGSGWVVSTGAGGGFRSSRESSSGDSGGFSGGGGSSGGGGASGDW
ncbi:MAG TPA: TPM domain-containing protein [Roseiarcus sp.]|jgi:uncharacterized protein